MPTRETFTTTTCTATCESEGHEVAREESKTCPEEGKWHLVEPKLKLMIYTGVFGL
jgi:hypothetical protein